VLDIIALSNINERDRTYNMTRVSHRTQPSTSEVKFVCHQRVIDLFIAVYLPFINGKPNSIHKLCFVDRESLYNLFQMKPTYYIYFNFCTCFGQLCAHHQKNLLYLCDTGIFRSVWVAVWSAGLQTRQPPIQSEKYQCRIDTASSPDDGHIVARNMYRS